MIYNIILQYLTRFLLFSMIFLLWYFRNHILDHSGTDKRGRDAHLTTASSGPRVNPLNSVNVAHRITEPPYGATKQSILTLSSP